jgi:hypothetical protein
MEYLSPSLQREGGDTPALSTSWRISLPLSLSFSLSLGVSLQSIYLGTYTEYSVLAAQLYRPKDAQVLRTP